MRNMHEDKMFLETVGEKNQISAGLWPRFMFPRESITWTLNSESKIYQGNFLTRCLSPI